MRKLILLALTLVMSISIASAINMDEGSQTLAQYFPAETDVYISARMGDDFVNELDDIFGSVINQLPPELDIPHVSLEQLLDIALVEEGLSYEQFRSIAGDHVAIGLVDLIVLFDDDFENDDTNNIVVVAEIVNRELLTALISENEENIATQETINGFDVYADDTGGTIAIGDDVVLIYPFGTESVIVENSLFDAENFSSSVSQMPADGYNILAYLDTRPFVTALEAVMSADPDTMDVMGAFETAFAQLQGDVVVGFTIIDGQTFTIDVMQSTEAPLPAPTTTVAPEFLQNLPATSDYLIIGTDLATTYTLALEQLNALTETTDELGIDPANLVNAAFELIGADFEEEVLPWLDREFAIVGGVDLMTILDIISTETITEIPANFGIIINAETNPALAANFAGKLGTFIEQIVAGEDDIQVVESTVSEIETTNIIITLPTPATGGEPVTYELILGVANNSFFFMDRASLDALVAGDNMFNDPILQEAALDVLPNPTQVLYSNNEGITAMVAGVLLGATQEMNGLSLSAPEEFVPTQQTIQNDAELEQGRQLITLLNGLFHSATTSTSIDGNTAWTRATLRINR